VYQEGIGARVSSTTIAARLRTPIESGQSANGTLLRSEEHYRALFEHMDQGFCVIEVLFDADGIPVDYRFLETNPAFERQSGLHDAVGKTILQMAPGH
jgi:PAS domain-containing protein